MKRITKKTGLLIIGLLILVLGGCEKKQKQVVDADGRNEKGLFPLRIYSPTGANPISIGIAKGYFEEEGIEIVYIGVLQAGVSTFQLLESNQLDLVGGHPPALAQARIQGIKAKAVGQHMVDHPDHPHIRYITQDTNTSIRTLDDLVGKKVGVSAVGPCQDGYIKYYLQKRGLDPDSVEFISFGSGGLDVQAVPMGLVDVAAAHPPYAGVVLAAGGVREIAKTWDIFGSPGAGLSVYAVRDSLIEEHPEVVQGLVNALYKSRVWTNAHQEESLDILAAELEIPRSNLDVFWYDPNKNIDPSYIDTWFEISESIGLWKHGDLLPTDIYSNQFVPKDPVF